jgi:hypothetical protein
LPFEDWWNQIIYEEKASGQLNRMRLVRALRDQDGGSHIDGTLTGEVYIHLKKGAGWQLDHKDGNVGPVSNLIAALMRQVAWEIMETLKELNSGPQSVPC